MSHFKFVDEMLFYLQGLWVFVWGVIIRSVVPGGRDKVKYL